MQNKDVMCPRLGDLGLTWLKEKALGRTMKELSRESCPRTATGRGDLSERKALTCCICPRSGWRHVQEHCPPNSFSQRC